MRILITDGNERSALAAVRSLLRAGHEVLVAASTRLSLAGASRGVQPRLLSTDPLMDPGAYASEVGRIAREDGSALVLPMTDASVEALLEHRKVLPAGVALPFPDLATYRAASDKAHVLGLARGCGFGVPETRIIAAPGELDASPPDAAFFPAIVKPHRSVVAVGAGRRKVAVTPVADSTACCGGASCAIRVVRSLGGFSIFSRPGARARSSSSWRERAPRTRCFTRCSTTPGRVGRSCCPAAWSRVWCARCRHSTATSGRWGIGRWRTPNSPRSEEHTSELQSR